MKFNAKNKDDSKQITIVVEVTGTIGDFINMFTEFSDYGGPYDVEQMIEAIQEAL